QALRFAGRIGDPLRIGIIQGRERSEIAVQRHRRLRVDGERRSARIACRLLDRRREPENAVSGADYGLGEQLVGETEARTPAFRVQILRRASVLVSEL